MLPAPLDPRGAQGTLDRSAVMRLAGFLGWPPEATHAATLRDLMVALQGRYYSINPAALDEATTKQSPMGRAELAAYMANELPPHARAHRQVIMTRG